MLSTTNRKTIYKALKNTINKSRWNPKVNLGKNLKEPSMI